MARPNKPSATEKPVIGENMRITVAQNQGGRRYMEDRCVVHTERGDKGELLWTFVGVFDGHGGEHASEYVRRHLLMNIIRNSKFDSDDDDDILESIRTGFLYTHEQMRHVYEEWPYTASGYPSTAGTTVSCVFIRNGKLYTGHVGDSAIYLGIDRSGTLRVRPLTVDHKPESSHEQMRITKAGGETAIKSGVTRVVWKRETRDSRVVSYRKPVGTETIPFLSVARSLGDLWSYNPETNMFIVSPEPDLDVHTLTVNDFCILLASDGMTNVLTGEQALTIAFDEEAQVEANNELNRNHARCVLRATLQKWRSLRADNVTVATVLFDLSPFEFEDNEMLMKLGRYVNCSQALTDRQDAMLRVSKFENHLLATQRCPVIYNGSKDANFARVSYRGPGFRTHEEELLEERRHLMNRFAEENVENSGAISIAGPTSDAVVTKDDPEKDETIDYDDDEEEEEEEEEEDASQEISLSFQLSKVQKTVTSAVPSPQRPPRPHAPMPVFVAEDLEEYKDSRTESTSSSSNSEPSGTPSKTTQPSVRRLKAEAVRRLRTPRIQQQESPSPDRRITRSLTTATTTPSPQKTSSSEQTTKRTPVIAVNLNVSPDAVLHLTPRRSSRLNGGAGMCTPNQTASPHEAEQPHGSNKLTMSRKRLRTEDVSSSGLQTSTHRTALVGRPSILSLATGITPIVSSLSLQDPSTSSASTSSLSALLVTPSRSAPSTPQKRDRFLLKKPSKWSLSQLDGRKKTGKTAEDDGIIRVSEVADDDEEAEEVMREPPSKIRRFYGYMRKFIWGK
ncbi:unnamed protein product [Caenorhabditis sp. 36 PRJEB53466]|nr:unnamed protein product [Caenorhabditis sp. 36 PRJEB53466]